AQGFHDEVLREYEFALQQGTPVVEPEGFFLSPAELKARLALFYAPELGELRLEGGAETLVCPFADNLGLRMLAPEARNAHARLSAVVEALAAWRAGGARVFLAARSETGAERLRHLLAEFELGSALEPAAPGRFLGTGIEAAGIEPASGRAAPIGAAAATGDLSPLPPLQELERGEFHAADIVVLSSTPRHGFRVVDGEGRTRFALVTEEEMLGEKARPRRIETSKLAHFIGSLGELKPGDPVVHVEYGIGRYEGLRHLTVGAEQGDFLVLHYAGEDKVYIPVHKLNLVQKFTGIEGATPALNRLGDAAWQRSKAKARRLIEDMAEELVRTQAARKARQGHAYDPHEAMLTEFEEAFPFQETDDQARAIAEVLADMAQPAPMDRLVCGDVGFGKTEVAMRAAYLAALDGRQVLVLVPTTILAQQHFETFTTRFTGFPVTVDVLSRFRKPQEQKAVVRAFAEGKLDILIGTHRLLSKDVQPKNLGLLVIDEEQRFGVAHKEKIKQLKAQVEVLTLSATPIPRTLHMSLLGVRDLSIINTPPMDRLAVRTRVAKSTDYIIREAVSREVRRGGQVFFVHNRVETIHAVGEYLRALMPEVRIAIAHGQMSEKLLEEVMLAFVHGRVDLLLCTSIVESGLDIARANTMIVNNADFYGLAQLYQLRGRVGRSNVQAYAFLLVSPEKVLTELAQKRLTLLQELNDLGSGFRIASQDLEIRGAGNLLGREQSGHINAIGLELYTAMVEEAVARLKGEEPPAEAPECRIELGFPYLLPEGYIESTQQRLDLYKRLAQVQTDEEAWEMRQLLEDRYGHLPPEVVNLFEMLRIRLAARALGLS
ncbi:MAG: transcription-repair coupling factor, partial [Candidatus Lambdaproteobacteria bacterium]|nr:transcription-repair coupling factor [Candidatus Lambdaproteobacteria bacterium]